MNTLSEGKQLVKDGTWQVPEGERPDGWREMGLREQATVHLEPSGEATITATHPEQLHSLQQTTLSWCRVKLQLMETEGRELVRARDHALKMKWNANALKRQVTKNVKRQDFYRRVVTAMEAGYAMFPTTEATVFAVRVEDDLDAVKGTAGIYGRDPGKLLVRRGKQKGIEKGEGYYVSSVLASSTPREVKDHENRTRYEIWDTNPEEVDFPLVAAKTELMDATGAAMELKVFDEIGLLPGVLMHNSFERTHAQQIRVGDPVIVGRIVDPTSKQWGGTYKKVFTFMIGWFIHTREL